MCTSNKAQRNAHQHDMRKHCLNFYVNSMEMAVIDYDPIFWFTMADKPQEQELSSFCNSVVSAWAYLHKVDPSKFYIPVREWEDMYEECIQHSDYIHRLMILQEEED